MDIDEFLERELADRDLMTGTAEKQKAETKPRGFEASRWRDSIRNSQNKGSLEEAEQSYDQLWRALMEQKLKWNKALYEQLSVLTRQFSSILSQAYNEVKRKTERIYELKARARNLLKEGKNDMSFRLYSEIDEIFNSIPNVFFEEKKLIQEQITDFYKELRNTIDNELIKRVSNLTLEIQQLINKTNMLISNNYMGDAIANYNKCIEIYNQIPEGFLRHKNSAGAGLLEIYKTLSIYVEISELQKQLSPLMPARQKIAAGPASPAAAAADAPKSSLLSEKKERAKKNLEKGFYNEASKDIQEALEIEPKDIEARVIHAKIKTLQ